MNRILKRTITIGYFQILNSEMLYWSYFLYTVRHCARLLPPAPLPMLGHQSADQEIGDPGARLSTTLREEPPRGDRDAVEQRRGCRRLGVVGRHRRGRPHRSCGRAFQEQRARARERWARTLRSHGRRGWKPKYQDVPFLVAFIVHMVFVLVVGLAVGIPALRYSDEYLGINATSPPINAGGECNRRVLGKPAASIGIASSPPSPYLLRRFTDPNARDGSGQMDMVVVVMLQVVLALWCLRLGSCPRHFRTDCRRIHRVFPLLCEESAGIRGGAP